MAPILIGTPVSVSNMHQHYALLYLLLNGTPCNNIQVISIQGVTVVTVNAKRQSQFTTTPTHSGISCILHH